MRTLFVCFLIWLVCLAALIGGVYAYVIKLLPPNEYNSLFIVAPGAIFIIASVLMITAASDADNFAQKKKLAKYKSDQAYYKSLSDDDDNDDYEDDEDEE